MNSRRAGLIDAGAAAGLVGQASRGRVVDPNTITDIQLDAGDQGEQYDFCEHLPSSISGYVYHDRNDNGIREAGEEPITGTTVTLIDQNGTLVGTEQTDANGFYEFTGLSAGDYRIMETQPTDWLDGQESVGRVDGERSGSTPANDTFHDVRLLWGSAGIEYNFGELKPGSLQGVVHADLDRDCIYDPIESPIAHVKIELLSSAGVVLATSFTDSQGEYSFEGLAPGQYAVRETQPQGYFHGSQSAGSHGGDDSLPDIISQIPIGSGQQLVHYDFCEIVPGGISGIVYVDPNQNDQHESSELLLAGVRVQLLDADSKVLATATTNANGYYEFIDLEPGTYAVREFQPDGYFHSGQQAGSHGGNDTTPDLISAIAIGAGENLTQYNFSEIPPSSLEGMVYVSTGSCSIDPDIPLAHITLELLDGSGNVIGTTQTDSEGHYRFDGLQPDVYSVRETQPSEYYQGGQCVGSGGGSGTVDDLISAIDIAPGEDLVEYNFYEVPAATLSGFVFQDGPAIATLDGQVPDNLASLRDGRRTPDDRPISGVVIELRNGLTGLPILGEQLLAGAYADGPVTTVTDARGYYEFHSLPAGNYAVYETHPVEYIDGIDTAGTTAGLAFNFSHDVQGMSTELMGQLLSTLAENPREDAIVRIPLQAGQASVENNFSEVLVSTTLTLPPSPLPPPLIIPPVILVAPPAIPLPPSLLDAPRTNPDFQITGSAGELQMTWHLSVVNGGSPRGMDVDANVVEGIWRTVAYLDQTQWVSVSLQEGHWTFSEGASQLDGDDLPGVVFGISGAIPISGDFNGDGLSEMGVYHEGQWFIDVNGNGQWDEEDLSARLGTVEDLPVVGDWDGDGKDDIGIFGPEWRGDKQAVKAEPGLPDPQNEYRSDATQFTSVPKNLPPEEGEATNGHRVLKHTSSATPRVDVIDHVFRFGMSDDLPVAGDWNGDGIRSIGVFRNGTWFLDIDGDGRQSARDVIVTFGRHGDVPVVGDFTGDGTDQIGVYRHGIWILDSNGDRELDARDEVFQLGDEDARPVVGDWDGDGTDEPAVYRDAG